MSSQDEMSKFLDGPALAPPPGVHPNFTDYSNYPWFDAALMATCFTISTLAVWMRIYVKACLLKKVYREDCKLHIELESENSG